MDRPMAIGEYIMVATVHGCVLGELYRHTQCQFSLDPIIIDLLGCMQLAVN